MHVIAAFAALGLLFVVLFPFVSKRLRAARRGRAVHLNGSCHWYANYDEELRYEPKRRSDIIRIERSELFARGYKPADVRQVVPRTFRRRVPGDTHVRLWKSDRRSLPPLWLCQWAEDPLRVSIGVRERERVPGVESAPLHVGLGDEIAESPTSEELSPLGDWRVDVPLDEASATSEANERSADWSELERARGPRGDECPATSDGEPLHGHAEVEDVARGGAIDSDRSEAATEGRGEGEPADGSHRRRRRRRRR
ncbi:MAG: hypothetical protein HYU52_07365 [Acidobacteria bacterium]|nr:hypothetical protein [Acidobacteriota bacterium]